MHSPTSSQINESEDQDTCRICSAPAEPDQPLFYPCKCAGTIRYIHQDCLTTWLAHSRKKSCDVCKHPYSFTKVYAPDMPTRLPPVLLIQRLIQQLLFMVLFGIRAIAVGIIWLALLPWITVWTWRMYFSVGDSAAWWLSDRPRPTPTDPPSSYFSPTSPTGSSINPGKSIFARVSSHPVWLALSADIFTGQIIASLVVLAFVAVFLLREWISQNARPGVFDDDELLQEGGLRVEADAVPQPLPAPVPQLPAPQPPADIPLVEPRTEDHRRLDAVIQNGTGIPRETQSAPPSPSPARPHVLLAVPQPSTGESSPYTVDTIPDARRATHSRRIPRYLPTDEGNNVPKDILDFDGPRDGSLSRRVPSQGQDRSSSPTHSSERELGELESSGSWSLLDVDRQTPWRDLPEQQPKRYHVSVASHTDNAEASSSRSSAFPIAGVEPPVQPIALSSHESPLHASQSQRMRRRRPPLVSSAGDISPSFVPESSSSSSSGRGVGRDLMDSPSLASYKAPEMLDAESSRQASYFDSEEASAESKFDTYFRERGADEERSGVESMTIRRRRYHPQSDEETEDDDGDGDGGSRGPGVEVDEDEDEDGEEILEGVNWEPEPGENDVLDVIPVQVAPVPVQQQGDMEEAPAPEANEELDANVEDDMEGAMEALGMRGPIYGVVQNAALMILVLDTALGLGVWIPFTIGKSAALLSLDPYRLLQILHFPIRAMRVLTDPVVDFVVYLIVRFVFPAILRLCRRLINILVILGSFVISGIYGQEALDKCFQSLAEMLEGLGNFRREATVSWPLFNDAQSSPAALSSSSNVSSILTPLLSPLEPKYVELGGKVKSSAFRLQATWKRMALGQGANERAFAVILGYFVVGTILSLYLNILTVGNVRSAGRAVRSAVRQQLLVMKVAAFIFIELAIFPLGCGIVLDLSTIWLFPETNLMSRVIYFFQAPMTAMFYHWVAGTMFMYSFAVLLAGCRSVMRPGAMWFVKDPQDQNSHPIRDILDRPTLTQLRKIFVSGLMYSFVVVCAVGSVAGLLLLGNRSIMPFRWKNRQPLSNVPIDLLFLHQALPYTMHYFRPKKTLKRVSAVVWRFLAHRLRLTSYFFGERHPSEEYSCKSWKASIVRLLSPNDYQQNVSEKIHDGSFRRVPCTDHIALPRDMRATAAVTENGEPFDEEAQKLIQSQNLEAEKAKRNIKDDYMVVYLPPRFRYRVILFIFGLWAVGAVSLGVFVALPIMLGRRSFKLFISDDVHDGYSFIVGFYLLWACYLVGKSIDRLDKRRQRRGDVSPTRSALSLYVTKRALLWIPKTIYMVIFLGIVIPILIAFVVDLYIVLPIRLALNPHLTPRIRVVDMWALGIVYINIFLHVYRLQVDSWLTVGVQNIINNGWTHSDPISATKEIIYPAVVGLSGMIVLPALIFRLAQHYFPVLAARNNQFIFMHVYPGIFAIAGLVRMLVVLFRLYSTWSQAIRDKEFLVEMRLRNLEPERGEPPDPVSAKDTETEYSSDN